MCGIISVVRRPGRRTAPPPDAVTGPLHEAVGALASSLPLVEACDAAAALVEGADSLLTSTDGVHALVHDRQLLAQVEGLTATLSDAVAGVEKQLDADAAAAGADPAGLELVNAAVLRLKDAVWAVGQDRIRTAKAVADLAGSEPGWSATEAYTSIQQALSAIDRLEVRGRDSAGVHVLVRDHGLDLASPSIQHLLDERRRDPLFCSLAVRTPENH